MKSKIRNKKCEPQKSSFLTHFEASAERKYSVALIKSIKIRHYFIQQVLL